MTYYYTGIKTLCLLSVSRLAATSADSLAAHFLLLVEVVEGHRCRRTHRHMDTLPSAFIDRKYRNRVAGVC
jgi:hypothetical protein